MVGTSGYSCAREASGLVGVDRGLNHGAKRAFEHLVKVVRLVARAVIRDAVLGVVVGADALGAVNGAHLRLAHVARLGVGRLASARRASARAGCGSADSLFWSWLFSFWQLTTMPVGMCVRRTAESVVLTDWPPGPERAEHVDADVVGVELDFADLLDLGEHEHAGRGGVDAALRLGCGHALHAVHAALVLEVSPHAVFGLHRAGGLDGHGDVLVAAHVGVVGLEHLGLPPLVLGVLEVHAAAGRQQTAPIPRRPRPT